MGASRIRSTMLAAPRYAIGSTYWPASRTPRCTFGVESPTCPVPERAMSWRDVDLGIDWPLDGPPIVSAKDTRAQTFADYVADPDFPEGWESMAARGETS